MLFVWQAEDQHTVGVFTDNFGERGDYERIKIVGF